MRKEVIFAIIIGLVLGLIILYGIRLANQSTKQAQSTLPPTTEETVTPTPEQNISGILIISPDNHAVINTSSIKIIGKTVANSNIAISDSEDDNLTTSDKDGNFSADLKLVGGENVITVTVLKQDQTTQETQISVIYTTAKIN